MAVCEPGLEAYVQAIERRLSRQRGRELYLSPPDFQLAREWFQGGLPLAAVLAGIDSCSAGRSPSTLTACRRAVERLAGACAGPHSADRPVPGEPKQAGELDTLAGRLEQLSSQATAFVDVARLARAAQAASGTGLAAVWEGVEQAALAALSAEERDALLHAARRALERQGANLSAHEREAALERHLLRRALERFGLVDLL